MRCPAGVLAGAVTAADEPLADASQSDYGAACDSQAQITYVTESPTGAADAFLASTAKLVVTESVWPAKDEADDRCANGVGQFPLAATPIAVVYNVAGVKKLTLSPAVLSDILRGEITSWDDEAIADLNAKTTLPSRPITVIAPQGESAATAALTGYLSSTGASGWGKKGSSTWGQGGQEASDSRAVAEDVLATVGSIGFTEWPAAEAVSLAAAKIKTEAKTVTLNESSVAKAMQGAKLTGDDGRYNLKINPPETAYPIVRPVYVQTCATGLNPGELSLLKDYLTYSLGSQWQSAIGVHHAGAIPDSERDKLVAAVNQMS